MTHTCKTCGKEIRNIIIEDARRIIIMRPRMFFNSQGEMNGEGWEEVEDKVLCNDCCKEKVRAS